MHVVPISGAFWKRFGEKKYWKSVRFSVGFESVLEAVSQMFDRFLDEM